jgi:hypothetical protein
LASLLLSSKAANLMKISGFKDKCASLIRGLYLSVIDARPYPDMVRARRFEENSGMKDQVA